MSDGQSTYWVWAKLKEMEASGFKLVPETPAPPPRRLRKPPSPVVHPTRTCKAILARLRAVGEELPGPDENYRIKPTYAGHWQRSEGAWSWTLEWVGDHGVYRSGSYGGYWPAALCAKAGTTLSDWFGDASLNPCQEVIDAHLAKTGPKA